MSNNSVPGSGPGPVVMPPTWSTVNQEPDDPQPTVERELGRAAVTTPARGGTSRRHTALVRPPPPVFRGLRRRHLGGLMEEVAAAWTAGRGSGLRGGERKRAAGTGRNHQLVSTDRVPATLAVLRIAAAHAVLAAPCGVSHPTVPMSSPMPTPRASTCASKAPQCRYAGDARDARGRKAFVSGKEGAEHLEDHRPPRRLRTAPDPLRRQGRARRGPSRNRVRVVR